MNGEFDHILLTDQEAATLLQPHMHNKSALHWLANDRLHEPAVPFYILQGQPFYREKDLISFIIRALNPTAHFIRIGNHLYNDNRGKPDRRKRIDRRINAEIALSPAVERRLGQHDRRLSGLRERRAAAPF